MATVATVLTRAYGYDDSFVSGQVADVSNELVPLVDQLQKKYFGRAAQINPRYWGTSTTIAASSNKWTLPSSVLRFWRIEKTDGTEVKLVSKDDVSAEFPPRVYQLGRTLYTVNETGDPDETTDSLVVYSNRYPSDVTSTSDSIDTEFPDHFYPLLEMGVAEYLARRAGLFDLAATLRERISELEGQFDAEVAGYTTARAQRWADNA